MCPSIDTRRPRLSSQGRCWEIGSWVSVCTSKIRRRTTATARRRRSWWFLASFFNFYHEMRIMMDHDPCRANFFRRHWFGDVRSWNWLLLKGIPSDRFGGWYVRIIYIHILYIYCTTIFLWNPHPPWPDSRRHRAAKASSGFQLSVAALHAIGHPDATAPFQWHGAGRKPCCPATAPRWKLREAVVWIE